MQWALTRAAAQSAAGRPPSTERLSVPSETKGRVRLKGRVDAPTRSHQTPFLTRRLPETSGEAAPRRVF